MSRILTVCSLLISQLLLGQGEGLSPLSAEQRQMAKGQTSQQRSAGKELFIYAYDTLDIPLMDDFSIDRTRWLDAQASDANTTLDTTLQQVYIGGSAPLVFEGIYDTTYTYTYTIEPDTILIDTAENASTLIRIYDICGENTSAFIDTTSWPPFDVHDTIDGGMDTTHYSPPDVIQDSLQVFLVDADTNMYMMGLDQTPLVLWMDDHVLVNGTYPVDPPTIGVASFDGLDRSGLPYDFDDPSAWGIADYLTSVPLDLQYDPGDSIYLSFFYQTIGLSGDDLVQEEDELWLEFWSVDDQIWDSIWSKEYIPQEPFDQVMVPITDSRYLKNGFQFRFKNYATLSGSLDHWHLDYVRLAENRTFDDTIIVDVAYLYEESTLLEQYTAMPWTHFEPTPENFMVSSTILDQKNLDINDRFIEYGMLSRFNDVETDNFINGINSAGNASNTIGSGHTIGSVPNGFVYDTTLADTCAWFDVLYYTNTTPDINRYNDTVRFTQNFTTYYAYDDGSAEAGYWLNVAGAKVAYEFNLAQGDSIKAVRMYFNPIFEDPGGGSFLITLWSDLNPENIIHQNFSFSSPEYINYGENAFIEYPLDSAIWVDGTIYLGWVQTTADKMNIGFDRNNNNGDKIFFNVANQFQPTSFEGSLMIRPVFVSEKEDPFLGQEEQVAEPLDFQLYPNPTTGQLWLNWNGIGPVHIELLDLQGRIILQRTYATGAIDLGQLADGLYLVRMTDKRNNAQGVRRLVLQR